MTSPKSTASALGFFRYGGGEPGAALFSRFFSVTELRFAALGIRPTYIGLDGDGYPADFTKFGGHGHKKALKQEFSGVRSVSVAATPEGSDEPMFDSFALVSLTFVPVTDELLLSLEVNEAWLPFDGEAYRAAVQQFVALVPWSFGFGFADQSSRQPGFHIQSLDPGNLSPEDRTRLRTWYAVPPDVRLRRPRDVYALNLLGTRQLDEATAGGPPLRSLIASIGVGETNPVPGTDLLAWTVPDAAAREGARKQLVDAGALAGQ